jgi:YHS domain-containing protein
MKQIIFLLLLCTASPLLAQKTTAERQKHFNLENKVAIQGYDPVAYFTLGKAKEGNAKINSTYLGITYNFSSENNKKTFDANPTKYEPQYGGWCAFAMGDYGKKVEVDPETFKIVDNKLYLFYNAYFNNTLTSWNKDEKNLKNKADKNWMNHIK